MKKFLIAFAAFVAGGVVLMGGCLAVLGGAADEVSKEFEAGTTSGSVSAEDLKSASGGDGRRYAWSDLRVKRDRTLDTFAGSVRVSNETGEAAETFVEITAYDGEQTLGTLNGSARVKPGASTRVDLTSLDDYAEATDFEVEISGF